MQLNYKIIFIYFNFINYIKKRAYIITLIIYNFYFCIRKNFKDIRKHLLVFLNKCYIKIKTSRYI